MYTFKSFLQQEAYKNPPNYGKKPNRQKKKPAGEHIDAKKAENIMNQAFADMEKRHGIKNPMKK